MYWTSITCLLVWPFLCLHPSFTFHFFSCVKCTFKHITEYFCMVNSPLFLLIKTVCCKHMLEIVNTIASSENWCAKKYWRGDVITVKQQVFIFFLLQTKCCFLYHFRISILLYITEHSRHYKCKDIYIYVVFNKME